MREIRLSDRFDFTAIVDDEDFNYLIRWRWTFKRSTRKHNNYIYATRLTWTGSKRDGSRRRHRIMMHNVILDRKGEKRPSELHTAHHINSKTLDNRRCNLEWASRSKQNKEAWKTRKNSS